MDVEQIICYLQLFIVVLIVILYVYTSRKKILYFLRHRHLPEKQMRMCPGCGSTILIPLGPDNVKCNDCGAIFAASRSIVKSKGKGKK